LVKNANGFILEEDLVALNNINPHDGIFVADGSVDNRKGQFIEPNEPGLMAYEDWLLEDRESKIESFIENTRTPSEGLIDIRKAQGQYFFSTPTAILHLIARGEKYFDLAKFIMTHDALESVAYFASIKEKFLPLVKHLNESDLNFRAATQAFLREKLKKEGYLKKFYLFASDDAIEIMTNSCIIQAAEDETHIREILEDVWSSVSRTLCLKQADDPGVKIFCD